MNTKPDFILLIHKQLTDQISPEEERCLQEWLDQNDDNKQFAEEIRLSWELSGSDDPEITEEETEEDLKRLMQRIRQQDGREHLGSFGRANVAPFYRYLAIVLLLIISAWGMYQIYRVDASVEHAAAYTAIKVDPAQQEVLLPDSTLVITNGAADLSYQQTRQSREVELSGLAFFQVARDEHRPFFIYLAEATIKVLGTSFLVKAVPEGPTEISVESGQVEVQYQEQHFLLAQGEQLIIQPGSEPRQQLNEDPNYLSWKENQLVFRQTPMQEVLAAIERHYGISISLDSPDILTCSFTGTFEDAEPDYLLEILSNSLGISTEWTGARKLRISGGGCH